MPAWVCARELRQRGFRGPIPSRRLRHQTCVRISSCPAPGLICTVNAVLPEGSRRVLIRKDRSGKCLFKPAMVCRGDRGLE